MGKRVVHERFWERTSSEPVYKKGGFWLAVLAGVVAGLILIVPNWIGERVLDTLTGRDPLDGPAVTTDTTIDAGIAKPDTHTTPATTTVPTINSMDDRRNLVELDVVGLNGSVFQSIVLGDDGGVVVGHSTSDDRTGLVAKLDLINSRVTIGIVEEVRSPGDVFMFDVVATGEDYLAVGRNGSIGGIWRISVHSTLPLLAADTATKKCWQGFDDLDFALHSIAPTQEGFIAVGRTGNFLSSSVPVALRTGSRGRSWCPEQWIPWSGESAILRDALATDEGVMVVGGVATRQERPSVVERAVWFSPGPGSWDEPELVGPAANSTGDLLAVQTDGRIVWAGGRAVDENRDALWFKDGNNWTAIDLDMPPGSTNAAVMGVEVGPSGPIAFGFVCEEPGCEPGSERAALWEPEDSRHWSLTFVERSRGPGTRILDAATAPDGSLVAVGGFNDLTSSAPMIWQSLPE